MGYHDKTKIYVGLQSLEGYVWLTGTHGCAYCCTTVSIDYLEKIADYGTEPPEKKSVTQVRNLSRPSTSYILPEDIRSFPEAGPLLISSRSTSRSKGKEKRTFCVANKWKWRDETFCIHCTESYSSSIPKEEWVECNACMLWAHTKYVNGNIIFDEMKLKLCLIIEMNE